EAGIRGSHVTGVQTCALPIYRRERSVGALVARVGEHTGLTATERHRVRFAAAVDLYVETFGQRVDDGRADAVQTTGCGIGTAAEDRKSGAEGKPLQPHARGRT